MPVRRPERRPESRAGPPGHSHRSGASRGPLGDAQQHAPHHREVPHLHQQERHREERPRVVPRLQPGDEASAANAVGVQPPRPRRVGLGSTPARPVPRRSPRGRRCGRRRRRSSEQPGRPPWGTGSRAGSGRCSDDRGCPTGHTNRSRPDRNRPAPARARRGLEERRSTRHEWPRSALSPRGRRRASGPTPRPGSLPRTGATSGSESPPGGERRRSRWTTMVRIGRRDVGS